MDMQKGISIVICCYNSAERLPKTLHHIAEQKISSNIPWELIIVNNNSNDDTKNVAEQFIKQHPSINGYLVDESSPGLSIARHKGFQTSSFEYVILCDDDNWLAEDYVETAFDHLEKNNEIGILGGVGEAVAENKIPEWFWQKQNAFAVGKLFSTGGYVKYVYGAGMVLRKSIYQAALNQGFVSLLSDRKGKELSSGGDIELCYIYQLMGYKIFQSDKLNFKHFVSDSKLTIEYKNRINEGFAKTILVLRPYDLVVNKRKESVNSLWFKEYCYIAKEAIVNIFHPKEEWAYLISSLKIMLTHRKEFCNNIMSIRAFAK